MPVVGLLAALATFFLRYISVEVLKYVALRALILSLVVVILPIVVENFLVKIFEESMSIATQQLVQQDFGQVVNLVGVFGWVAQMLKLPEAMAVVISAIGVRFALSLIPFVRI